MLRVGMQSERSAFFRLKYAERTNGIPTLSVGTREIDDNYKILKFDNFVKSKNNDKYQIIQ